MVNWNHIVSFPNFEFFWNRNKFVCKNSSKENDEGLKRPDQRIEKKKRQGQTLRPYWEAFKKNRSHLKYFGSGVSFFFDWCYWIWKLTKKPRYLKFKFWTNQLKLKNLNVLDLISFNNVFRDGQYPKKNLTFHEIVLHF